MNRIRLLLAYGDRLCREGIRALLERIPGVEVVAEAGEGRKAAELARRQRPDLAILEDTLPVMNGVEAASRILRETPGVRVAILGESVDVRAVAAALLAGSKGYLLKSESARGLARVIREIMADRVALGSGVSRRLLRPVGYRRASKDVLTPRQREILQMIAEGWSTKQVAKILRISGKTVETHRSQLMERLEVYDVPGLVRYALKTRLSSL